MRRQTNQLLGWLFFFFVSANITLAAGSYLSVTNSPSITITTTNLASGAGSDLTPTAIVTTTQSLTITVSGIFSGLITWEVDVALSSANSTWPSGVSVTAKRTTNGGNGTISGGTAGVQVTNSPQALFTGRGSATIAVQYSLSGLSLASCSPGTTYSYPLTYTFGT